MATNNGDRDLLQRGIALQKSGQLEKAAALYDQVLAQDPQHPDALHLLGLVNANQGRMLPTRRTNSKWRCDSFHISVESCGTKN
jgi:tetratricopeptide (TPR) repeat protein